MTPVAIVGFEGVTTLPIWVAIDRGHFAREGLDPSFAATRGAIAQMQDMMADTYQFALTAMDNIAGYSEGQSDVGIDGFDLVAIGGLHSGSAQIVVRPEIAQYRDIKGKQVAVDALQSGYGFLLYRLLEKNGLTLNVDYGVLAVGSGPGRLTVMKDGKAAAAVLDTPNDLLAEAAGFTIMADVVAELGAYQGTVYAARRSYAAANRPVVRAFLRAVIAAHRAIFADKEDAIAVLRQHVPSLTPDRADAVYRRLTTAPGGFDPNAALNLAAVRTTLALRSAYAEPKMSFTEPERYIDMRHYDEAVGG